MNLNFMFFINNLLLGIGLAADAFSVSLANGLSDQSIKKRKIFLIAAIFAIFQALMPFIGWFCVHNLLKFFEIFNKFIPWIALALLTMIGTKMIIDSIKNKKDNNEKSSNLGFFALIVQGIATSIDALSVGFTFANFDIFMVLISILIIAVITFVLCFAGVFIGKKCGTRLSNKATLIGGIILILIGLEIFISGLI